MTDTFDFSRMIESISLPADDEQPLAHFQHGISVILTIDDTASPFVRTLPSLMPQKFLREIIVVDIGASEELLSCIKKVATEFPILRIISNKRHLSKYQALNLAAKRAFGKYLLFVEQDAILPKDATVKLLVGFANKGDAPSIIAAQHQAKDKPQNNHQLLDPKEATMAALGFSSKKYRELAEQFSMHVGAVHPGCFMISRSHFWLYEGFDLELGDIAVKDLCLKMHMNGGGVYLANDCSVKVQNSIRLASRHKSLIKYYRKHFSRSSSRRWLLPLSIILRVKGMVLGLKSCLSFKQRRKQMGASTIQQLLEQEAKNVT